MSTPPCTNCNNLYFNLGQLYQEFQGNYEKPGPWQQARELLNLAEVDLSVMSALAALRNFLQLVKEGRVTISPKIT